MVNNQAQTGADKKQWYNKTATPAGSYRYANGYYFKGNDSQKHIQRK